MIEDQNGFYLDANEEPIQQVHALQLAMLLEVDAICRKHGLSYYLIFGTLLGAVRHGGFIPWDDDIDIGLLRDDYEQLLPILETELDETHYKVQTAENDAGLTIPFAKIRCNHTIFQEFIAPEKAEYHQGVFLDIFPLDNVPDEADERRSLKRQYFLRHFALRRKIEGYTSRFWFLNLAYALYAMADIPDLLVKRREVMTSSVRHDTEKLIAFPSARADYDTSFLLRAQLAPAKDISFCGHPVMAPAETDAQLTMLFGDYMKLPPVEDRKGHHLRRFDIDQDFWKDILDRFLPQVRGETGEDPVSDGIAEAPCSVVDSSVEGAEHPVVPARVTDPVSIQQGEEDTHDNPTKEDLA